MAAIPPTPTLPPHRIRLPGAVAVVLASMVGVAVYTSLGYQLQALNGGSGFQILLLWTLGAAIAFVGAVSYGELAAALPASGGEYHFLSRIYHPSVGFLSGWISLVAGFPGPVAFAAVAFTSYLVSALAPGWAGAEMLWAVKGIAVGLIVAVTLFHTFTLRTASRFHGAFTVVKVVLLLALTAACFFLPKPGQPVRWTPVAADWAAAPGDSFITSLYYVLYAYSGWNAACYIASEVSEPQRRVPLALLVGVGVVFLLYVGVNASFLHAAPVETFTSPELLNNPAFAAAQAALGSNGARWVAAAICLGLVSSISAMTWTGPRVAMRMGQDYRLLARLGQTNKDGIPVQGLWLQSGIAAAFVLAFDDPERIVLYVTYLLQVSVSLTVLGVFVLRRKEPDLPRPYKAWGYPYTPALFLLWEAVAMTIFLRSHQNEAVKGLGTLMAGIVVYLLCRAEQRAAGKPGTTGARVGRKLKR